LEVLGFGCVEIGTVTPQPQPGNDKPRLFRLPKDKALINRMGFNNEGADAVVEHLKAWRMKHPVGTGMIIGGNIGKNKVTPNEYAYMDYDICFRKLYDYADYFVVNVSSPNTPGLRELQDKEALRTILTHLQEIRAEMPLRKPLLLKIAPDLEPEQLDDVASLALEIALDGLVATNTTTTRSSLQHEASRLKAAEAGQGGLSGLPVRQMSTNVVKHLSAKLQGRIPIIASGGIFTAVDAREKLEAGASLVQVWTGFVYEGPAITRNICSGL
jgi:dihydroorotate dehydrogenase